RCAIGWKGVNMSPFMPSLVLRVSRDLHFRTGNQVRHLEKSSGEGITTGHAPAACTAFAHVNLSDRPPRSTR
ncbi:MAG: hypothetical protein OXF88_17305, partial [Rhodobacteraceae bacterium]|nr:hypothetical protein [Paracoccaceae bacterium]